MKLLLIMIMAVLAAACAEASVIGDHPLTTTVALPAPPLATSYQVVSRNVNRVLVPHVPTVVTTTSGVAYPGYAYPYRGYGGYSGYGYPAYGHAHSYGYGYGYPAYGYANTVW